VQVVIWTFEMFIIVDPSIPSNLDVVLWY